MKIKSFFAHKSHGLSCALMAIALSPLSLVAAKPVEVVDNLKWTYSIFGTSARIENVAAVDGSRIEGVIQVPASFGGGATVVTALGYRAFARQEFLQGVRLPPSLDKIGPECFRGCKRLVSLELPPQVQTIGALAFSDCSGLRSIKLNEGLVTIERSAFRGCSSLKTIDFPTTLVSIGHEAFCDTRLESVELPDSVKSLGSEAFARCDRLETVTIGKGIAELPIRAFFQCENLRSVTFKDGFLDVIKPECFRRCKRLVSLELPSRVQTIGALAFSCPFVR